MAKNYLYQAAIQSKLTRKPNKLGTASGTVFLNAGRIKSVRPMGTTASKVYLQEREGKQYPPIPYRVTGSQSTVVTALQALERETQGFRTLSVVTSDGKTSVVTLDVKDIAWIKPMGNDVYQIYYVSGGAQPMLFTTLITPSDVNVIFRTTYVENGTPYVYVKGS